MNNNIKVYLRKLIFEILKDDIHNLLEEESERMSAKDKLINHAKGAMGEFFKVQWSKANGSPQPSTENYWYKESLRLLNKGFKPALIRASNKWGIVSLYSQVLEDLENMVAAEIGISGREFSKDFYNNISLNKLIRPDDEKSWLEFRSILDEIVTSVLEN